MVNRLWPSRRYEYLSTSSANAVAASVRRVVIGGTPYLALYSASYSALAHQGLLIQGSYMRQARRGRRNQNVADAVYQSCGENAIIPQDRNLLGIVQAA